MMKDKKRIVATVVSLVIATSTMLGCGGEKIDSDFSVDYDGITTASIKGGISVHDPSIVEDNGQYYIFGSHMTAARSTDLRNWTGLGDGYSELNSVYGKFFDKDKETFAYTGDNGNGNYSVWAPDVIYNKKQGLYYMYCCTSSTYIKSNLCYATAENIEGPYEWQGALIYSGFTRSDIDKTNVYDYVDEDAAKTYFDISGQYNNQAWPNAIDPTVFYDKDGKMWMVYGSWSGGIFLLEIDENTGEVIHPQADPDNNVDAYFGKRLLGGGHNSIEGPYIQYDEETDYYYLYVSYGALQSDGGYQIRVFRSKTVDGDYEDMNGEHPVIGDDHSKFGLKLSGNYYLPSLVKSYMATGHNSSFIDKDGKKYICYHTRFDDAAEYHQPRVHQYLTNSEGWPCMLPYATDGETVSDKGYNKEEIVGEYYLINQGTAINSDIARPIKVVLSNKGNVYGDDLTGTWKEEKDSYRMTITLGDKEYSGVFCKMNDEAGTEVMTFSAVGDNESIWAVKY